MSLVSETVQTDRIVTIVEPSLTAMGYEIVRILLRGGDRQVLQVMIDRTDGDEISVEDCAEASRTISVLLDVEDPIGDAYDLEVSSPGIDRPLTRPKDFERFAGLEARIELNRAIDGRKRFRGRLLGLADDAVRLSAEDGPDTEFSLPLAGIVRAKLVLNDELLAATRRAQTN